jgi:hypothetical protein
MSGTRYHAGGGGAMAAQAGNLVQNLGTMGGALRDLVGTITELQGVVLREVSAGLRDAGLPSLSLRNARSCAFPEYARCDPDLGALVRDVQPGETVRMPVRFRNTTGKRRTFAFAFAGPLKDSQGRTAKPPALTPASLDLDDGEVGRVLLATPVGDEFAVGAEYSTRLVVRAEECDDQHLTVTIRVACDDGPVIRLCCACDPKVRPLRWYHHYYCDPPPKRDQPERR